MADRIETHPPRSALILPLSRPECPFAARSTADGRTAQRKAREIAIDFVAEQLPTTLESHVREHFDDRDAPIYRHNWLQALRAIRVHTKLDGYSIATPTIVIIHTTMITDEDISAFKELVKHYVRGLAERKSINYAEPRLEVSKNSPVDFEDFSKTVCILKQIILDFNEKRNIDSSEICIDITGGQRVFSVAASQLTKENTDLIFSYVRTYDQDNEAPNAEDRTYTYDVRTLTNALSRTVKAGLGLP